MRARHFVVAFAPLAAVTVLAATTTYDADDRPSTVQDPLGRSFTVLYDADSNRTELRDFLRKVILSSLLELRHGTENRRDFNSVIHTEAQLLDRS